MKLKRINIKRFGIYRDEKMEDIGPELVVIGGRNRAGKSTFIELLKHIGYGFNGIPYKDRGEYEADADVLLPTREQLNIAVKGLAEPKITSLSAAQREYTPQEIYRGIDPFTYHRLFTINLEELQKIPTGIGNKESARLQSVLLGAGLSEMLYLPQIEDEFKKDAKKIGGERGKASTSLFKDYNKKIKDAVQGRDKALEDVEEYYLKQAQSKELGDKIDTLENNLIPQQERVVIKYETLDHLYPTCAEKVGLQKELERAGQDLFPPFKGDLSLDRVQSLREEYKQVKGEYEEKRKLFKQQLDDAATVEEARAILLQYRKKIEAMNAERSGLKEKVNHVMQQKTVLSQEVDAIKDEMNRVNCNWNHDFTCIEELKTDQIEKGVLQQVVTDHDKVVQELEELRKELNQQTNERDLSEEQLGKLKGENPGDHFKGFFAGSIITAVLAALAAVYITPWLGFFLGLTAIGGIIIFFINRGNALSRWHEKMSELNTKIETLNMEIRNNTNEEIRQGEIKANQLQEVLGDYKKQMGLPEEVMPAMLVEHFNDIQSLKSRVSRENRMEDDLKEQEKDIQERFEEILQLIREMPVRTMNHPAVLTCNEMIDRQEAFFSSLERLKEGLQLAEGFDLSSRTVEEKEDTIHKTCGIKEGPNMRDDLEKLEQDIRKYQAFKDLEKKQQNCHERICFELEKTPVLKAFDAEEQTLDERLAVLDSFFNEFASHDELKDGLTRVSAELQELRKDLNEVKKAYQALAFALNQLATSEKIEKAQHEIVQARNGLRPLAEQYAIYRIAAFILKNVRESMVEKAKNQSLAPASDIFNQITDGNYSRILPSDELTAADFKAVQSDDSTQGTVDILSRGTREQLFLSVRLSRIREMDPLPVIIDDSLVNFDPHHIKHAASVLTELSKRNQVFVLTCHPEVLSSITEQSQAQYWRLENGKFSLSDHDALIKYLES